MSDEKISAMSPPPGGIANGDIFPLVRPGVIDNFAVSANDVAAYVSTGIPIEYVSTAGGPVSFALPADHSAITVCEDSGTYNVITVTDPGGALINGHASFTQLNQPYANYTFRWRGTQWRVF
jgi:hypothetical protein